MDGLFLQYAYFFSAKIAMHTCNLTLEFDLTGSIVSKRINSLRKVNLIYQPSKHTNFSQPHTFSHSRPACERLITGFPVAVVTRAKPIISLAPSINLYHADKLPPKKGKHRHPFFSETIFLSFFLFSSFQCTHRDKGDHTSFFLWVP